MSERGVINDGAVYVDAGTIEHVRQRAAKLPDSKYRGATRIRTGGTIFPGFIELHNHLAYNAMPLWQVPTRYTNNGQWRGTETYTRRITKPSQVLGQSNGAAQALVRYTECRALLGGTTCSQGLTLANAGGVTKLYAGLLRNPEAPDDERLPPAGTNIANPETGGALAYLETLAGHSCYLQHLSEGTDTTARGWFERLKIEEDRWAVNDRLCAIHCTALHADDFRRLARGGATMVWSPLSNYLLYGETADIGSVKEAELPISLGSDWAPSGSKNLLGEIKVAWLASREHGGVFEPRELVEMITTNPARALKWEALLGSIEPGKLADLVVVDGQSDDAYLSLIHARESTITLVLIGGVPRVGQSRLMGRFWDEPLQGADWIDELRVGDASRRLFFEQADDVLEGLQLSAALETLRGAMARLPELAVDVDSAVAGAVAGVAGPGSFAGGVALNGDTFRVVPDFEAEDDALLAATLGAAAAAEPYSFWVTEPLALDPLTVVDDGPHLRALLRARNLPEFVKRGLPGLYGTELRVPDSASFLEDAGVDPQLRATTTDLGSVLDSSGQLTLEERRLIVDQAIVLLTETYVHLPLKRAMHAVDPVQRLRLLRQSLDELTPETMPAEIGFHAELMATFNSLRDLHTGYRLPAPFNSKVAWLPFLVEEVWDRGERQYLLTKWVQDAWPDPAMDGGRITHWNGMSMETAVARTADRTAGSNLDARHARGVSSLTIRPLVSGLPPDEDWVVIRWLDSAGTAHDHQQEWLVFEPGSPVGPRDLLVEASAIGIDDHTDDVQQARKALFAQRVAMAERAASAQAIESPISDSAATLDTFMPGVFRAMEVQHSRDGGGPAYGYIRIFTFNVPAADPFVDEFVRLAGLLPDSGLVIDVRGNGGGLIYAAEQLLQVLTPHEIEPEPAQFVNTVLNLKICRNHRRSTTLPGLVLEPWIDSIQQATRTGAAFSRGIPITSPDEANRRGQAYQGPVVLITDALSYSATDLFAAGFQDHAIGPVIGVGGATGAGGANVWTHALLRRLMEPDNEDPGPSPFEVLPRGADLRVAVRRTTRVGPNAGNVLEDLGVVPAVPYRMSRRDVMEGNQDLIDLAVEQLETRTPHSVVLERVQQHRDRAPTVTLRTRNVTRVDVEVDGRRLQSRDVRRDRVTVALGELPALRNLSKVTLLITAFEHDEVVATLRVSVENHAAR